MSKFSQKEIATFKRAVKKGDAQTALTVFKKHGNLVKAITIQKLPSKTIASLYKETEIQRQILDWLNLQKGVVALRINNTGVPLADGGFRPPRIKGVPDIIACVNGRFVGIECKSPKGKTSDAQEAVLRAIDDAGGIAIVASSLDLVIETLTPYL